MNKDLFSGLQDLGFDDIDEIDLYNKKKEEKQQEQLKETEKEKSLLFDREVRCPVCDAKFKVRAVKTSAYKIEKKDTDFFLHYVLVNPYFYDVWLCNSCGYAALKADFPKIKHYQIPLVTEKITPKWHGKEYPDMYDVNIAIERYKLALLNYYYMDTVPSKKAMVCLKIAWMYRISKDSELEVSFLKQAVEGFNNAYFNEDFPIYGMDKFAMLYLMGELNRRIGHDEEALSWFSKVITTPNTPQKIKDIARDQRDLIKTSSIEEEDEEEDEEDFASEKKGFFSRFFKK